MSMFTKTKISEQDAETILEKIEKDVGVIPEKEQMVRMVTCFEDRNMAINVINYIITFLNTDTLKGYINHDEFVLLYINATKGLYKLMFLDLLDARAPADNWESYRARLTASFTAAHQFIYYMMSRVVDGRQYELDKLSIEVKRPQNINIGRE